MDELIAYIKEQDEKIKNLETNEKVRELKIVELTQQYKSMVSKCGGQATNKVKLQKKVVEKDEEIKKLKEENKGLVQQIHNGLNAQVEVEEENEGLKMYWRCFLDYTDPRGRLECPDKEFIDGWTDDEEVRQSLYEDFDIEEDEEEEEEEASNEEICKEIVKTIVEGVVGP